MLNGQTFSSRTGKTSGLPKFELRGPIGSHQHLEAEHILPEPSPAIELRKQKV